MELPIKLKQDTKKGQKKDRHEIKIQFINLFSNYQYFWLNSSKFSNIS